jgi:membrane peptidoglycan carboxypeptidase
MINDTEMYDSKDEAITTWRSYMQSMGLGGPMHTDIPGEQGGLLAGSDYLNQRYPNGWDGMTIWVTGMGQGDVTCTPLQLCNLAATIANRGWFITPHVVREIEGDTLASVYTPPRHTMAPEWAYNEIAKGMRSAALGGTCKGLAGYDFTPCGKTGTAQNRGHDHSVFMGFAPMNNPKIAVAVYVENGGWGATYGVPIGGLLMEQYLHGELSEASELKAKSIQEKAFANPKLDFMWDSVVQEIRGDGLVESMVVKNVKTGELTEVFADEDDGTFGIFVFIGYTPSSAIYEGKVDMERGYILTDEDMRTNIKGVFAAGDIRKKSLKQVVTAAADGAIAAVQASEYIEELNGTSYSGGART